MGILENFENSWDIDSQFESKPMPSTDNMGRSTGVWTEGPAVYNSLTVKLFSETVCKDCETESTPIKDIDNMGREKFWEDLGRP